MLVHGFDMHRIFLSAPGDLASEKIIAREAISAINGKEAMPDKILMVTVGLPDEALVEGHRSAVAENIRQVRFFLQIFEDDWGPKNLMRKMFYLAWDGRADASLPMEDVVVFLKAAPRETDPEILGFRKELEDVAGPKLRHFKNGDELRQGVHEAVSQWLRRVRADSGVKLTAAPSTPGSSSADLPE